MSQTIPAHGTARWLEDCPVTGNMRLRITTGTGKYRRSTDYDLERVPGGWDLWRLDPATFTLICRKVRTGKAWTCDCQDATHRRQGGCRHIQALKAALDALPF